MKRVAIATSAVVVLAIVVLVVAVRIASRDIPAPDVSDLVVERPELAREANAFTYFSAATNTLYEPSSNAAVVEAYMAGSNVDAVVIADVLARNEETFSTIDKGLECERCLAPEVTGFESLLPYLSKWRGMGRAMALKARHERLAGHCAAATDTCVSLLRFGDMIQVDAECLINYLVGISVLQLGMAQAEELARDEGASAGDLRRLAACLAELGPFDPGLVRAIKIEHRMVAGVVDDLASGKFGEGEMSALMGEAGELPLGRGRIPGYVFQPNRTKLEFAGLYRNIISNAPLSYAEMRIYDVEGLVGAGASKLTLISRPNAIGRILHALLAPSLSGLLERKCRSECGLAGLRLLVAVELYRRDTGDLPADLDELIPGYLAAVPRDPYDGRPFRYDRSKQIVYSVGKDVHDSGGSTIVDSPFVQEAARRRRFEAEDVVFELEPQLSEPDGTRTAVPL